MGTTAELALLTVGQIATREQVPLHRVEYAIAAYDIQPTTRGGNYRLFDEAKVNAIRSVLRRIAERRGDL